MNNEHPQQSIVPEDFNICVNYKYLIHIFRREFLYSFCSFCCIKIYAEMTKIVTNIGCIIMYHNLLQSLFVTYELILNIIQMRWCIIRAKHPSLDI